MAWSPIRQRMVSKATMRTAEVHETRSTCRINEYAGSCWRCRGASRKPSEAKRTAGAVLALAGDLRDLQWERPRLPRAARRRQEAARGGRPLQPHHIHELMSYAICSPLRVE